MAKIFLNLTNGIEALPFFSDMELLCKNEVSFVRIQSTVCEQKDWDRLVLDLDNNLLMHLALGYDCQVYDRSAHDRPARAIRQGLELVKFLLEKFWFGRDYVAPDGQSSYFRTIRLGQKAENKLKYYRRFLSCDEVRLSGISDKTTHDGDYEWYANTIKRLMGMP